MNFIDYQLRRFQFRDSFWIRERNNNELKADTVGPAAYTEKCMDQHQINWYVAALANFFPQAKRILVDERD